MDLRLQARRAKSVRNPQVRESEIGPLSLSMVVLEDDGRVHERHVPYSCT